MWYTDDLIPITLDDVAEAAEKCHCNRVYMHWTAGRYGQAYEDYHINIDEDGSLYCIGDLDFDKKRDHTWHNNTGSIGIALCCAYGAIAHSGYDAVYPYGYEPTQAQIEAMAMVIATICKHGHIDIDNCLTHKEQACKDGYGVPYGTYVDGVFQGDSDLRWDLWMLPDYNGEMIEGGKLLRGKARWYINR